MVEKSPTAKIYPAKTQKIGLAEGRESNDPRQNLALVELHTLKGIREEGLTRSGGNLNHPHGR